MNKLSKEKPILLYTLSFIVVACFAFYPYYQSNHSLITNADAIFQHYPALVYWSRFLRRLINNILFCHSIDIPYWDFGIGYGADIITTLHYYCLGEPLTLFSIFFRPDQIELCFSCLIILRLYLSGLFSLLFFRWHKLESLSSCMASIIYSFCGFAVGPAVFHPFFGIPMVYCPLILLGVDLAFEKKPFLFIVSTFLAIISNIYFAYMLILIAIIYIILTLIVNPALHKSVRSCISWIVRFSAYGIVALLLSSPIFLPNAVSLLSSNRVKISTSAPSLYPLEYYLSLPSALITNTNPYYYYVCESAIAVFSVFVLFFRHEKNSLTTRLKYCLFICVIFSLFPFFGSLFNGFSYPTNRWIWAFDFFLAFAVAIVGTDIPIIKQEQRIFLFLLFTLFAFVCLVTIGENQFKQLIVSLLVLLLCLINYVLYTRGFFHTIIYRKILLILSVISVAFNSFYYSSPSGINWAGRCVERNASFQRYLNNPTLNSIKYNISSYNRYESKTTDYNSSMLMNINGTSFYFSTVVPSVEEFQRAFLLNSPMSQQYKGLDARAFLEAALGVSLYVSDSRDSSLPFLFDEKIEDIITKGASLPIVYTLDKQCTHSSTLSAIQKQQLLLQCAMVDTPIGLFEISPQFSDEVIPFIFASHDNIDITSNSFHVMSPNSSIVISLDRSVVNAELYCSINNLNFNSESESESETVSDLKIRFSDETDNKNELRFLTPNNSYYCGYHDFLVNIGYSTEERNTITITFPYVGNYSFDNLTVICQPLSDIKQQIRALSNSGISNIQLGTNAINFNSSLSHNSVACIAIPYSDGWHGYIDGSPAEIIKIQYGLCGMLLPEGSHNIRVTYTPPLLVPSFILSGVGLFGLFLIFFLEIGKRK